LHLYESPTSSSFPTQLVWQSPALANILGSAICGDTDRDGNLEIIHSVNTGTSKLIIFENKGDNNFQQVYYDVHAPQDDGRKAIADFDGDGLMEIAVCGTYGHLRIYESPSNDVWVHAFDDPTALDSAYGIAGGLDTDGNGLPELFIAGNVWDEATQSTLRKIYIYESPGPDQYQRVRVFTYSDQHTGGLDDALVVTNIDGVGLPELVIKFFREIHIYRAPGPGQWNSTLAAIDPDIGGIRTAIYCLDANDNGLPEVFWLTSANTLTMSPSMIVEHPGVAPSDIAVSGSSGFERLVVTPTPSRSATTIQLGPRSAQAAALAFFDASGRLIGRYPHNTGRLGFDFTATALRPGIYFIRAQDGSGTTLATGRAVVVR
jgi:hypothetical protein